jgi:hypothetical protein
MVLEHAHTTIGHTSTGNVDSTTDQWHVAAVLGNPLEDVLDPRPPPFSGQLSPRYNRLLVAAVSRRGIMSCLCMVVFPVVIGER